jgi:Glycosyltransferase 61
MKSQVPRTKTRRRHFRQQRSSPTSRPPTATPPVCDDMQAWCEEHTEGECREVVPASLVLRQPPRTCESHVHPSFELLYGVGAPARRLIRVAGARLVGRDGLVVLPDGSFVGELIALTAVGRKVLLGGQPAYHDGSPRDVIRKPGHYYPLFTIGWENYYHWNHDVIMRASLILDHLPSARFIVPSGMKPFHHESLSLLGIDESRLETFDGEEVWELESLSFSTPILKTQIDTVEPLEWFRTEALARYGIPEPRPKRRLYISRRLDRHHRTVNEAELEACLRPYGFETVLPATMSLRDQAALFSEAEIIVGTGSGLNLNMVFSAKGARIVQFQDPTHIVHAVWTMAEALGHHYWYVMGEAIPNPGRHADIYVPIDKLKKTLDAVLSATPEKDAG